MRTKKASHAIIPPGSAVTGVLLDSERALREGTAALAALDPVMARLVTQGAQPVLRKRPPGFEGLAGIVVGQQISTAAASAIWGRLTACLPDLTAETLTAAPDETLRGAGLSAPKIRTLRAAADAVIGGALPLDSLHALPADEAHRLMVAVHGIGPWTADVYLLFCLGHPDAFPGGDLALQEAARLADGLETRPTAAALIVRAEAWRPWRGVAAKVLWAYYRVAKARDGAPLSP
ncbi:DNA-3-methyladenine glycosylase family protein [Methylobacterium aquaticum]|uniref:DNA-3-methyladenine glycosylase family protein n=1 Tax=Methylobacterium aquaticum TaxID=270351 RepID=UPI0019320185|nr:DNA-3-methyladenine glycosylase 2 family protein [Methylobacterium aquaticum]QRE73036.1 DNA-3-methyladenine glycosylase 2 family protein [Methylobacterium aquaticum]